MMRGAEALARGLGRLPPLRPERHELEIARDVPYVDAADRFRRLDVYRPRGARAPLPALLYLHGGGFQFFDKSSHWSLAARFARAGLVVFNANYRLAPAHPFPAAAEDAAAALLWLGRHAERYGADPAQLVIAGESAGANLTLALAVAACWRRPEPWAAAVFAAGLVPRVVLPACGFLDVTCPERFAAAHPFVRERIRVICAAYLPPSAGPEAQRELASPLLVLERAPAPERAFPACFAIAGGRDPVCEDSLRLARALERLGVPHDVRVYPGGLHAFHAYGLTRLARAAWADQLGFVHARLER
jgi:acetyl esterase